MVFPSLEAFEQGVNLPSIYVFFYDYFVKSSVGDSTWKEACLDAEDPTEAITFPRENPLPCYCSRITTLPGCGRPRHPLCNIRSMCVPYFSSYVSSLQR
jgi:hypothetical protein